MQTLTSLVVRTAAPAFEGVAACLEGVPVLPCDLVVLAPLSPPPGLRLDTV